MPDLLTDGEEHPLPDTMRESFELIVRSLGRSDWGLAAKPVAAIARIDKLRAILIHDAMADCGWRVKVDDTSWQRSDYTWHFPQWAAAVGVRVRGEPGSDWYLVSEIHPGRGRRIKLLDIARY